VVLDLLTEFDEAVDLGLREDALLAFLLGDRPLFCLARLGVLVVHRLLLGHLDVGHLAGRPVDDVVVGRHGAGDDAFAESPGGLDDDLRFARRGVGGEHHAGLLGGDHLLDHDGDVDLVVVEALLLAVVGRPLGKQRGPAPLDPVDQPLRGDVEERLLLPGEGGVGQVLGGGRGAYRDERLTVPDLLVGREDFLAQVLGHLGLQDEFLRARFGLGECFRVLGVDVDGLEQLLVDTAVLDESAVGASRHDEPRRNRQPGSRQFP